MLSILLTTLLSAAGLSTALPASTAAKAYQIRGVSDPIYHLYLQAHPSNASLPVLGPESSSHTFNIGTTIQSVNTSSYLNIISASTSYKPLVFGATGDTTAWGLEGDTIITTTGSTYGRQLNFVACTSTSGYYELFLQTGSDVPSGRTCTNYETIHLPCLC